MKSLRLTAAVALAAAVAVAFAGWLTPDNVLAFASAQAFCR